MDKGKNKEVRKALGQEAVVDMEKRRKLKEKLEQ